MVNQPSHQNSPDGEMRHGLHIYGSKYALTFEADSNKAGYATVAIDACKASGIRQYDWANKIRIQLTLKELPCVAAVLLGYLEKCEFTGRGPEGKAISVQHQGDKVYMKIWTPEHGSLCAVPIDGPDTFKVTALFLKQLRQAYQVSDVALVSMLKNLAVMSTNQANNNKNRSAGGG